MTVEGYTENVPFPLVAEIQLHTFELSGRVYDFDTIHCMVLQPGLSKRDLIYRPINEEE